MGSSDLFDAILVCVLIKQNWRQESGDIHWKRQCCIDIDITNTFIFISIHTSGTWLYNKILIRISVVLDSHDSMELLFWFSDPVSWDFPVSLNCVGFKLGVTSNYAWYRVTRWHRQSLPCVGAQTDTLWGHPPPTTYFTQAKSGLMTKHWAYFT